ncbi:MAG TPA: citrate synthase [Deltaproteobacteria bacterium]|nr:citrate synthase [Deltaproteobacteria bacterium]HCY10794.1 citrate synthase [Deltaproteobacteria bacterium]
MDVVPGLEGILAAESAISFIDGDKGILEYRGIPVEALAEKSSFIETSWLLLFGRLPESGEYAKFRDDITFHTRLKFKILRMMEFLPENGHPMHYLQAVTSAMGMYYPARETLDPEVRYWSAVRLIAKLPTIVAAVHRLKHGDAPIQPRNDLSFAANFYYMLFEKEPSALVERILDVMLILHADHTMNASTFSARVVGSTLADPYTIVASAIGTLSGPLHGGANEEVVRMIDEIGTKENVRPYIERKLERKEKVMGVGHRVYRTVDPRGEFLKGYISLLAEHDGIDKKTLDISREIEAVVRERLSQKNIHPNIDFYSGIILRSIGIPTELFTPIFAMGRVAGWLAHWMEQLKSNRIYRPEQKYTGLREQPYIPMEERK